VEYRALGESDLRVSEIRLGTWTSLGGSLDDVTLQAIEAALPSM
jgi:aryl-alcohol dehydrogenase-like predicted oxidoreductase